MIESEPEQNPELIPDCSLWTICYRLRGGHLWRCCGWPTGHAQLRLLTNLERKSLTVLVDGCFEKAHSKGCEMPYR
jgi:hypothetical protein